MLAGRAEETFFHWLLSGWLALAPVTLVLLLFVSAPYGRHGREGYGPKVPARLGWLLMELPALLTIAAFAWPGPRGPAGWVLLGLFELHYLHRAVLFPFRLPTDARPMPLSVAAMGATFNLVNGYLNGRGLGRFGPSLPPAWLHDPRFLVGVALFVTGYLVNLRADAALLALRRAGGGYQIPRGGLFRWVSCPNYLGEIVEWSGFALAAFSLPALSFALWTAANLAPRAMTHHQWYQRRFPDYPSERRALVPFLL